jgi:Transposase DDE domain.
MLLYIFCDIHDFCKGFEKEWIKQLLSDGKIKRVTQSTLSMSEVMTIVVWFHISGYRTFKWYYKNYVCKELSSEFPNLVSYSRFVELMPSVIIPLCAYLHTRRGKVSGVSFIDSLTITVCKNIRIPSHRVFRDIAQRGKNSVGWFYGFKLHLIINDRGEFLAFRLTAGNVDDRKHVLELTKDIFGKLFGDRGYISQELFEELLSRGVELITKIKSRMRNRLMSVMDKLLLRKRAVIESVNDQLKNISQIEHSRHRSVTNFMVNIVCALIAYTYQPKKPSIGLEINSYVPMAI